MGYMPSSPSTARIRRAGTISSPASVISADTLRTCGDGSHSSSSLLPGHMDIWWHMDNVIDDAIEQQALSLVERRFGAEEVAMLLEIIEEGGFERGTIGQAVHAIIDVVPDKNRILEGLAFDPAMSEDARYWALLLLVFHRQFAARSWCVQIIDRYMARFPADENEDVLASLRQSMVEGDTLDLY